MEMMEISRGQRQAVREVISGAFRRDDEADLVEKLRGDGDVALELAACENGKVVGHILFSELIVEPATVRIAALAPLSVSPSRQKTGIGSALVRDALVRGEALGFDAVAVLGDNTYYGRFGFLAETARPLRSVFSSPHYQALELKLGALSGGPWKVTYPRAFG